MMDQVLQTRTDFLLVSVFYYTRNSLLLKEVAAAATCVTYFPAYSRAGLEGSQAEEVDYDKLSQVQH